MDNGPESITLTLGGWSEQHGIRLEFIKLGNPTQNAFVKCFSRI